MFIDIIWGGADDRVNYEYRRASVRALRADADSGCPQERGGERGGPGKEKFFREFAPRS